jgi:hypothetical protein
MSSGDFVTREKGDWKWEWGRQLFLPMLAGEKGMVEGHREKWGWGR